MKSILVLLIIALALATGYEYHQHHQQTADFIQQRSKLAARIVELMKQNKGIADEEAVLTEKLTYLQKEAADLKTQTDSQSGTNAPSAAAP